MFCLLVKLRLTFSPLEKVALMLSYLKSYFLPAGESNVDMSLLERLILM